MIETAVKERPILMSGEMVRAVLDGRKSQTRRIVKFTGTWAVELHDYRNVLWPGAMDECGDWEWLPCRYGNVGDRLWVRESFDIVDDPAAYHPGDGPRARIEYNGTTYKCKDAIKRGPEGERWVVDYAADKNTRIMDKIGKRRWRPSIHMPRWASRLTLELTDVRIERVQDISAKDIIAEGVVLRSHDDHLLGRSPISAFDGCCYPDLISLWAAGWEKINGKGSWKRNDWVWVLCFKRLDCTEAT